MRIVLAGAAAALISALGVARAAEEWPEAAREAQAHYEAGEYDAAVEDYRTAMNGGDPRAELPYNLGNALYRAAGGDSARYEEAFQTYQRAAAAGDRSLRPDALYNAANAAFRLGRFFEAESLYREVLRQNPQDEAARFNLEFVQRILEGQPPPPQGSPGDDQQKPENQEQQPSPQDQEQSPQDQPQNADEQGPQEQTPPEQDQPAPPEEQGADQQEPPPPPEEKPSEQAPEQPAAESEQEASLSEDEARRELEKLEEAEKEILQQILQAKRRRVNVEKDW